MNAAQDTVVYPGAHVHLEGGTLDAQTISFQGGGEFEWTSGTLHVVTFNGNLANQGGTLVPGHSAGVVTIAGSYTQQAGAILAIEIGGTVPGSGHDRVNVTASATLGGELQLAMLNGFAPAVSDSFTIFDATGGVSGVFSNIADGQRLTTMDGNGSFLVHYGPSSVLSHNQIVLTDFVPVALPGDYNHNGIVDTADYTIWRDSLGRTGVGLAADGNGNNKIEAGDYNVWKTHFGQISLGNGSAESSNIAIPEPAPSGMLLVGMLAIISRRRKTVS